jgi:hypothetical protein
MPEGITQQPRESVIPLTRERRDPAFRWQEWLNQHILLNGQVALLSQSLALLAHPVLGRPHGCPRESTRTGLQNSQPRLNRHRLGTRFAVP